MATDIHTKPQACISYSDANLMLLNSGYAPLFVADKSPYLKEEIIYSARLKKILAIQIYLDSNQQPIKLCFLKQYDGQKFFLIAPRLEPTIPRSWGKCITNRATMIWCIESLLLKLISR